MCAEYIRLNEELAGLPEGKEENLSELERKKMELEEKAASMQVKKRGAASADRGYKKSK